MGIAIASLALLMPACTNTDGNKLKPKDAARLESASLVVHGGDDPDACTVMNMGQMLGAAALTDGAGVVVGARNTNFGATAPRPFTLPCQTTSPLPPPVMS